MPTTLTSLKVKGATEVTGVLNAAGGVKASNLTESTYKVTTANASAAASTTPTKAEFDAVVTLVNEIKADYNKLLKRLITGADS